MANIQDTEPLGRVIIENLTLTIPIATGLFIGMRTFFLEWSKVKLAEIEVQVKKLDVLYITNMEKCFNDLHDKKNEHQIRFIKEELNTAKADFKREMEKMSSGFETYKEDLIKIFKDFK